MEIIMVVDLLCNCYSNSGMSATIKMMLPYNLNASLCAIREDHSQSYPTNIRCHSSHI